MSTWQPAISAEAAWWNGFLTAIFFAGTSVLGSGLWSHASNTIVYGTGMMFLSLIFWLIAAFG
jgi:hypothetical protein